MCIRHMTMFLFKITYLKLRCGRTLNGTARKGGEQEYNDIDYANLDLISYRLPDISTNVEFGLASLSHIIMV